MERVACIGGGVIGSGWAARLLLNGVDVSLFDPDPQAQRKVAEVMANAERAYTRLAGRARPAPGTLRFAASIAEAVEGACFVQESVPERLELKRAVLSEVDAAAPAATPVASSTSGLLPSDMQADLKHPGRLLVGHPFVPVYLLPLVEVVPGRDTDPAVVDRAGAFYRGIGMKPVTIRKEIDAFVADRLMEALWREALWLVNDDVAGVEDIDDVMRYSFGLRWAQMGVFQVFRVAGGEAGMRHFMEQFGPALKWPWTKLVDVPELDDALVDKIVAQSDRQAGDASVRDLERIRDDNLVDIMAALARRDGGWGAGRSYLEYRRRLAAGAPAAAGDSPGRAGECFHACKVEPEWIDYNGHMTEFRYAQVFSDATDAVLERLGAGQGYVAGGQSWYTVETHARLLAEASEGDPLSVHTRFLHVDDKRMHVFHSLFNDDAGILLATSEQMLLHVDTAAGRTVPAPRSMAGELTALKARDPGGPWPEGAGRRVGERH